MLYDIYGGSGILPREISISIRESNPAKADHQASDGVLKLLIRKDRAKMPENMISRRVFLKGLTVIFGSSAAGISALATGSDAAEAVDSENIYLQEETLKAFADTIIPGPHSDPEGSVGGGSLIYSSMCFRTPSAVFEQRGAHGGRIWPDGYTRENLNPYYDTAESVLKVVQLGWTKKKGLPKWQLVSKKDGIFAKGCDLLGRTCDPAWGLTAMMAA
jgi:hypothetical protein